MRRSRAQEPSIPKAIPDASAASPISRVSPTSSRATAPCGIPSR
ncbi:MAG: hypothetical protein SOR53_10350 [Oscillospiraceae bacterium]|nr:hypothetical protein [Oscillospiraceae bacterium]